MQIKYEDIVSSVNKLVPNLSQADKEDLIQDVVVKLVEANADDMTKGYIAQTIRNTLTDRHRKELSRPDVVFSIQDYGYDPTDDIIDAIDAKYVRSRK
jgi:DNA-directed RNA polymerase specialized sigma24 family protein